MRSLDATPLRVLLVDDDRDDFDLTRDLVHDIDPRHELDWAPSFEQGLSLLRERRHDVCLLDYSLGARNGLEFLREALATGCSIPVVMLTTHGGSDLERGALGGGASDYLEKGSIDADRLCRALRHSIERSHAIQQLRERERLFRAVFDSALDVMLIADDRGRYVDANPAALELLGWSRQELLTKGVEDIATPELRPQVPVAWATFLKQGRMAGEWALLDPAGTKRIFDFRATANILPGRHLSVMREITERRRAEATRARFAAIVESADDAIIGKDPSGIITDWNAGAERLLACPAASAIGRPITDFVPEERRSHYDAAHARLQRGESIHIDEGKMRRADGRTVEVSLIGSPMRGRDGSVAGACLIVRDITETKTLRSRLAISDRMATVGTLAAGVAHEINNPLAAVMANLEFAANELDGVFAAQPPVPGSQEVLDARSEASDAAAQVRQIVRDLKIFSRADSEELGPVEVERVIDSAARMAANEVRHRARLVRDHAAVPPVLANDGRLSQVVLNLLVNAAQSIPEGQADKNEIRVWAECEDGRVRISVRDTGAGIPAHVLPRIFEPFFTTKPVGQGTGLGLSICLGIMRSMGGEIEVETELGKGTTFHLLLSVSRDLPQESAGAASAPQEEFRPARVLVVDDDELVLRAAKRSLDTRDEVVALSDSSEALARISAGQRFDVILCDVMMPDLNGIELHAQIAALAPDQASRMIFMTGGAFSPTARAFLDTVPNPRLDKPWQPSDLRDLIRQVR